MSDITYPATAEEFEEYNRVMREMADEAEASTPDPTPEDFRGAVRIPLAVDAVDISELNTSRNPLKYREL